MNLWQQRIAIGKALGTINQECELALEYFKDRDGYPDAVLALARVPDYPNDLNAMREAEKALNAEQQMEYGGIIHTMVHSPRHWKHINFDILHASSTQRSEAFLRAIGKWDDQ